MLIVDHVAHRMVIGFLLVTRIIGNEPYLFVEPPLVLKLISITDRGERCPWRVLSVKAALADIGDSRKQVAAPRQIIT